jgi:hypothetical protein
MRPIQKPHFTRVLMPPSGWNAEKCGGCSALPITDSEGVMYSYWRPSWRERLSVLIGKHVRVCVLGTVHPPVALDTDD